MPLTVQALCGARVGSIGAAGEAGPPGASHCEAVLDADFGGRLEPAGAVCIQHEICWRERSKAKDFRGNFLFRAYI